MPLILDEDLPEQQPPQQPTPVVNQTITATIYVNGALTTNPQITIARQPFMLERYDYDKIVSHTGWGTVTEIFLGATAGLAINLIAKLIANKIEPISEFDDWEMYAVFVAGFCTVASWLIHKCVPNERKRIINKINNHFKNT